MGYHILTWFILLLLYCFYLSVGLSYVSVSAMQVDIYVLLSAHVEHFEPFAIIADYLIVIEHHDVHH